MPQISQGKPIQPTPVPVKVKVDVEPATCEAPTMPLLDVTPVSVSEEANQYLYR